jgi:glycosyl-4,4'-diaponeurosporenoate acyltransferase
VNRVGLVVIDSLAWTAFSAASGFIGASLPASFFRFDSWVTRIRPFEREGRLYRNQLHINRWKDRLPETNRFGPGNRTSKAKLSGRAGIAALLVETRRAEFVHLAIAATGPLFLLWNPPLLGAAMVAFGVLFNVPFIAVQRYNRARILRLRHSRADSRCDLCLDHSSDLARTV